MESKHSGSVKERLAVGCMTLGKGFPKDGGNLCQCRRSWQ